MSLAAAPRYEATYGTAANDAQYDSLGAQTLLHLEPPRPNYFARVAAIVLYFALLAGFVTIGFRSNETPIEDEQVIELAPLPNTGGGARGTERPGARPTDAGGTRE